MKSLWLPLLCSQCCSRTHRVDQIRDYCLDDNGSFDLICFNKSTAYVHIYTVCTVTIKWKHSRVGNKDVQLIYSMYSNILNHTFLLIRFLKRLGLFDKTDVMIASILTFNLGVPFRDNFIYYLIQIKTAILTTHLGSLIINCTGCWEPNLSQWLILHILLTCYNLQLLESAETTPFTKGHGT